MKPQTLFMLSIIFLSGLIVPSISAAPITNVAPTPYSSYEKGDSYTTIYVPTEIAPPNATKPPIITIKSLANNTKITTNNITLSFELILESPATNYPIVLQGVCYKPSWQSNNISLKIDSNKFYNKTLTYSLPLSNITDGDKSVTVYASILYEFESGREEKTVPSGSGIFAYNYLYVYSNYYFLESSSSVNFDIDTSLPATSTNATSDNSLHNFLYPTLFSITVVFVFALVVVLVLRKKRKASTSEQVFSCL